MVLCNFCNWPSLISLSALFELEYWLTFMVTLLVANFGGVNGDDKVFVTGALTRFIDVASWLDEDDVLLVLLVFILLIFPPCCKDLIVLAVLLLLILSDG